MGQIIVDLILNRVCYLRNKLISLTCVRVRSARMEAHACVASICCVCAAARYVGIRTRMSARRSARGSLCFAARRWRLFASRGRAYMLTCDVWPAVRAAGCAPSGPTLPAKLVACSTADSALRCIVGPAA